MKKATILILAVFMVGFLMACSGGGDGSPSMAALSVLYAPNPVDKSPDGRFHSRMTLMEENGIGAEIVWWRSSYYNADDSPRTTFEFTSADFVRWFNDCGGTGTYIPGGGSRCADWWYEGGAAYGTFTFAGRDDLGNTVEGTGRVDFNQGRDKSLSDRISN